MFFNGFNMWMYYAIIVAAISTGINSLDYPPHTLAFLFIGKFVQFYYILPLLTDQFMQLKLKGIAGLSETIVAKIIIIFLIGLAYSNVIISIFHTSNY